MMKKLNILILILAFLIMIGVASGQSLFANPKKFRSSFIETENYGIREKPITNREYILFLCWNIDVFGTSYPEHVVELLPLDCIHESNLAVVDFKSLFVNSHGLLKDYVLNIKYIDYPVTGLSLCQVSALEKWLSDRYNENMLIYLGRLNFNAQQKDEDCFVLESYLSDQYTGSLRNDKRVNWKDGYFLPVFRLPYSNELNFLKINIKDSQLFKEYKFKRKDFLWTWNEFYLKIDENKNELRLNFPEPIILKSQQQTFDFNLNFTSEVLTDESKEYMGAKYFEDVPIEEKNQFGNMDFVVIGETNMDRLVTARMLESKESNAGIGKVYWVAFNNKISFEHWPK